MSQKKNQSFPGIRVVGVGYRLLNNREYGRDESCDLFEMVVVDAGRVVAFSDRYSGGLKPGQAMLHQPGIPHTFVTENADNAGLLTIRFQSEPIKALLDLCGKVLPDHADSHVCLVHLCKELEEIFPCIGPDADTFPAIADRAPYGWQQLLNGWLTNWLILQIRHQQKYKSRLPLFDPASAPHSGSGLGQMIADYIREHPYEAYTLSSLCKQFNIGRTRLDALLRAATGQSPMTYVRQVRLDTAKQLLRTTDRTVSDLADALQFSSVFAFSGFFKARVGCSPTVFRQQILRGRTESSKKKK